jgi:hypothetical protein
VMRPVKYLFPKQEIKPEADNFKMTS